MVSLIIAHWTVYLFFHLAAAGFLAASFSLFFPSFFARAGPPFNRGWIFRWPGLFRRRATGCPNVDEAEKRQDWVMRGFRQFDAPVSVVVTYDRELQGGDIAQFDCGALVNGLVTAAWSKGLGAVVNSQGIMQSPVVREHAGIADDQVIMKSIALGWPDESFPANAVVSERKSVDEATVFVGFDN